MSFILESLKDIVRMAETRDADQIQTSARLDDKAQKTVTVAGLLLAGTFGFYKPDTADALLNSLGI